MNGVLTGNLVLLGPSTNECGTSTRSLPLNIQLHCFFRFGSARFRHLYVDVPIRISPTNSRPTTQIFPSPTLIKGTPPCPLILFGLLFANMKRREFCCRFFCFFLVNSMKYASFFTLFRAFLPADFLKFDSINHDFVHCGYS